MNDTSPTTLDASSSISAVAALDEPARRRLYDYVVSTGRAVGRDEAAEAAGVSRGLAAFHLDRLAEQGLLSVEYRRLSGRTGRGAGRPSKLYRRAEREFSVQLPPRSYALAGDLMAEAIEGLGSPATDALDRAAHARGLELGRSVAASATDDDANAATGEALTEAPAATQIEEAAGALARLGYEPLLSADGELRLGNCPF